MRIFVVREEEQEIINQLIEFFDIDMSIDTITENDYVGMFFDYDYLDNVVVNVRGGDVDFYIVELEDEKDFMNRLRTEVVKSYHEQLQNFWDNMNY